MGLMPSMDSFYQSMNECDEEEYLKARAQAQESDSDQCRNIESLNRPASTFNADVFQVVPCKFIISLAFTVNMGKCQSRIPRPSAKK